MAKTHKKTQNVSTSHVHSSPQCVQESRVVAHSVLGILGHHSIVQLHQDRGVTILNPLPPPQRDTELELIKIYHRRNKYLHSAKVEATAVHTQQFPSGAQRSSDQHRAQRPSNLLKPSSFKTTLSTAFNSTLQ